MHHSCKIFPQILLQSVLSSDSPFWLSDKMLSWFYRLQRVMLSTISLYYYKLRKLKPETLLLSFYNFHFIHISQMNLWVICLMFETKFWKSKHLWDLHHPVFFKVNREKANNSRFIPVKMTWQLGIIKCSMMSMLLLYFYFL